jgi:hypothetical protein
MEISAQPHVPVTLISGKGINYVGSPVDVSEKIKITEPSWDLNPGSSTPQSMPTEPSRLQQRLTYSQKFPLGNKTIHDFEDFSLYLFYKEYTPSSRINVNILDFKLSPCSKC